ncbi:hypothetical protein BHE74_00005778 [Ensete ventricosum]|nr:hypothetical protein BHE74_00005778 [Ensete ventricosum]
MTSHFHHISRSSSTTACSPQPLSLLPTSGAKRNMSPASPRQRHRSAAAAQLSRSTSLEPAAFITGRALRSTPSPPTVAIHWRRPSSPSGRSPCFTGLLDGLPQQKSQPSCFGRELLQLSGLCCTTTFPLPPIAAFEINGGVLQEAIAGLPRRPCRGSLVQNLLPYRSWLPIKYLLPFSPSPTTSPSSSPLPSCLSDVTLKALDTSLPDPSPSSSSTTPVLPYHTAPLPVAAVACPIRTSRGSALSCYCPAARRTPSLPPVLFLQPKQL